MAEAAHRLEATELGGRPAYVLASPDARARATVVPELAMLCWSLTLDGVEFLGRPNDLGSFAAGWATTGIPLLHPWANRLEGGRLVGTDHPTVTTASALVPTDERGLPIHGLNLADAGWEVDQTAAGPDCARLGASLRFADPARLTLFPYPHLIAIRVVLRGHSLEITTEVRPIGQRRVPVSFGWHPYFTLPGVERRDWRVSLPVTRRAELDARMIPTGRDSAVSIPPGPIGDRAYDDLFTALRSTAVFELAAGDVALEVAFGPGYPMAQVYAPPDRDVVAFEPMTAPTNAMVTGDGLVWVGPGELHRATFTVTPRNGADARASA